MRYYFDLRDGDDLAPDEEGIELRSMERVQQEAAKLWRIWYGMRSWNICALTGVRAGWQLRFGPTKAIYGPGNFDFIWPGSVQGRRGGRPADHMSSGTMLGYLQRSMNRPDATIHGFRASFETWSDDQFIEGTKSPKYHPHAVEFCLAHVAPGGKTKRAYRRGMMFDARIGIMNDWADFSVPRTSAATSMTAIS